MLDSRLLAAPNQCDLTGLEKPVKMALTIPGIYVLEDNFLRLRFVIPGKVALWLEKQGKRGYTIKAVYTAKECRRQGLARDMLAYARACGLKISHSQHLTTDGQAWQNAVK